MSTVPSCLGDGAEPAFGGVGVGYCIAQSVGLREQVAVLIVGVLGNMLHGVRHLGDVIQHIVLVAGGIAHQNGSNYAFSTLHVAFLL